MSKQDELATRNATATRGRRQFFGRLGGAAGFAALGLSPMASLLARAGEAVGEGGQLGAGFGPLKAIRDRNTGLPLLRLPAGFSYTTFGWAGEKLADGTTCPGAHDGMGIVRAHGDVLTLVRNHEVAKLDGAFGDPAMHYDAACSGGTVTLEFDVGKGELLSARPSLSGTMQNCAGGVTPWGSWLSCEEFVSRAGIAVAGRDGPLTMQRDHGFVFEVPAEGGSNAQPLRAMGQFRHEAATVHAASGDVYLTEDAEPSAGFYRFVPKHPGKLADGGKLFMLRAAEAPDLRSGQAAGARWKVEWVPIEYPERGYLEGSGSIQGVHMQGLALGGSRFTRLEGAISQGDEVFFTATNGGDTANGQVFCYHPSKLELELVYESSDAAVLDYPDNVCLSPRGGLLICQDAKQLRQNLFGLSRSGELFKFAQQNVVLDGAKGFSGDFRSAEWAGVCFSPDGRWLFANVYSPGFSVAITGPWREGLL